MCKLVDGETRSQDVATAVKLVLGFNKEKKKNAPTHHTQACWVHRWCAYVVGSSLGQYS